jgi:hypothetical protein
MQRKQWFVWAVFFLVVVALSFAIGNGETRSTHDMWFTVDREVNAGVGVTSEQALENVTNPLAERYLKDITTSYDCRTDDAGSNVGESIDCDDTTKERVIHYTAVVAGIDRGFTYGLEFLVLTSMISYISLAAAVCCVICGLLEKGKTEKV